MGSRLEHGCGFKALREGRVCRGAVQGAGSCWSPFQPSFLQGRGGRGRRTRPLTCLRRPLGLWRPAASPPRPPRASRLRSRPLRPAAPATSPARDPPPPPPSAVPALPLAVESSSATPVGPVSSLLGGPPQPPSSSHSPPGQVCKFGVRVALVVTSFSA